MHLGCEATPRSVEARTETTGVGPPLSNKRPQQGKVVTASLSPRVIGGKAVTCDLESFLTSRIAFIFSSLLFFLTISSRICLAMAEGGEAERLDGDGRRPRLAAGTSGIFPP